MNIVTLIGRLTKNPELIYSPSGVAICKITLAVNREFSKNKEQTADFLNCTAFNKTAEHISNYQTKGNKIAVIGRIQTGSYENNEGKRVFTTGIIIDRVEFLEIKKTDNYEENNAYIAEEINFANINDDLPF